MLGIIGTLSAGFYRILIDLPFAVVRERDIEIPREMFLLGDKVEEKTDFLEKYRSVVFFSYRFGFESLSEGDVTSDQNWGCAIRVAQMQAAACLKPILGEQAIIPFFRDTPTAPLSIHRFIAAGGRKVGEKYSPGDAASIMSKLLKNVIKSVSFNGISVVKSILREEMLGNTSGLCGLDLTNPCGMVIHINPLGQLFNGPLIDEETKLKVLDIFALPYFRGLASGWRNCAYFIVAACSRWIYYLDPHIRTAHVDSQDYSQTWVRRMPWASLARESNFAFYVEDSTALENLLTQLDNIALFDILDSPYEAPDDCFTDV